MTMKSKKITLHKPHGKNKYCGPAVMSAITGFSTDECAAVYRLITGQRYVKGMYTRHMRDAFSKMGGMTSWFKGDVDGRMTFAQWVSSRDDSKRNKIAIVNTTGHYVVVLRDMFIENQTKEWVHVNSARVARHRVKSVIWVAPPVDGKWNLPDAVKAAKKKAGTNWKAKATKLASELGMHVYKESSNMYYVGGEADDQDLMEHLATGNRLSGYNWEDLYQGIVELYDEAKDYIAKHQRQAA
jgi:hypothetical protein